MENKPKTSSYKRLKPYIKGFQIPFVLAIFGAIISAVITVCLLYTSRAHETLS